MLGWALTFLILALVAGYMGFFGLAGLAASIARLRTRKGSLRGSPSEGTESS